MTGKSHVTLKQGHIVEHDIESMHKTLWTVHVSKLWSNVTLLKDWALTDPSDFSSIFLHLVSLQEKSEHDPKKTAGKRFSIESKATWIWTIK